MLYLLQGDLLGMINAYHFLNLVHTPKQIKPKILHLVASAKWKQSPQKPVSNENHNESINVQNIPHGDACPPGTINLQNARTYAQRGTQAR